MGKITHNLTQPLLRSLCLVTPIVAGQRGGQEEESRNSRPTGARSTEMDTQTEIASKEAAKAEAAMTKRKAKLAKDYPHARIDTLTFDASAGNGGKYKVQIQCTNCADDQRWVHTSDLFQVKTCTACSEAAAKAKKAAKKAELKAAAALLKEKSTVQA